MHRHGYKGRKFGRKTDQRAALTRGLMCALIKEQAIETTLARAKEIRRSTEKLITIARKGGLANRRLLIARLGDLDAATILMDEIAPQIQRDSGYLTIERIGFRRGDNAEMAMISFVDDIQGIGEDGTTTVVRTVADTTVEDGGTEDVEPKNRADEEKSAEEAEGAGENSEGEKAEEDGEETETEEDE